MLERTHWIATALACAAAVLAVFRPEAPSAMADRPLVAPVATAPEGPWSEHWDEVAPTRIAISGSATGLPRAVDVRAAVDSDQLVLMFEWPDSSEDLSFEGAYYSSAVFGSEAVVQETKLLRDSLSLQLSLGTATIGTVEWRSKWQFDVDRKPIAKAREEFGTPVADYYELNGDGAYGARYLRNTNAIGEEVSACRWTIERAESVYENGVFEPLDGGGRWKGDRWRIQMRLPLDKFQGAKAVTARVAIADGGLAETEQHPARSLPIVLALPTVQEAPTKP